jgi:transcriptional regulator with PAS, ATPase and Fis domain
MNKPFTALDPEATDVLVRYEWPGNVRELGNAVERAMVVGSPPTIRATDLPIQVNHAGRVPVGDSMAEVERAHVQSILDRTQWNITRAAEILRIDRVTLYNKIKKYDLRQ